MQSYNDKRSRLSSAYFRAGMLDGFRGQPLLPETHHYFSACANTVLAYGEYNEGYLAGLDARSMPTYEIKPNFGRVGGAHRTLSF